MINNLGGNNLEGLSEDHIFKGDEWLGRGERSHKQGDPSLEIDTSPKEETIFHLEFHCEGEKLRVRQFEGSVREQKTLRHYEDFIISLNRTEEYSKRIKKLLSGANSLGRVDKEDLISLKQSGQLLYNELFPPGIKESLNSTHLKTLILGVDDRLVYIPWELVYEGQEFLCQRFNVGRVVSTRQHTAAVQREIVAPLKMLIITDPQGNLPASYKEGIRLLNMLDEKEEIIKVNLKSSEVNTEYVKGKLKLFDIFHYAGHAEYNGQAPAESGFLLNDGKLTAKAIREMVDRMHFPSFVFSNACQSGETDEWKVMKGYENVFGLANAFLLSGVRHYLGTLWEIQDESGFFFSLRFYEELLNGAMIGDAVRKARMELIERYGEDTVIWASYVLYGDPSFRYVPQSHLSGRKKPPIRNMEEIPSSTIRASEKPKEVFTFPRQRKNWHVIAISIVAFWALIAALLFIKKSGVSPIPKVVEVKIIGPRKKSAEDTMKLIDELDENMRKKVIPKAKRADEWTSIPIILVFLDIEGIGVSDMERDFIQGRLTEILQNTGRITFVERAILDELLREQKLSHSDLADPTTALRIGKMLSARLISTGSIAREKNVWMVSLRFIETETTAVKVAISTDFKTRDVDVVSREIGTRIFNELRRKYPLQGKITTADEKGIFINLGSDVGMNEGVVMEVLSADNKIVGRIVTVEVMGTRSSVKVLSGEGEIKVGLRIKEIVPETEDPEKKLGALDELRLFSQKS